MKRTIVLLVISFFFSLLSCSKGPSGSQVIKDWNEYVARDERCKKFVSFKKVEVVARSVEGTKAEIILEVTGEWISPYDPHFFAGPCDGFRKSKGQIQKVQKRTHYTKYDTGWRIMTDPISGDGPYFY